MVQLTIFPSFHTYNSIGTSYKCVIHDVVSWETDNTLFKALFMSQTRLCILFISRTVFGTLPRCVLCSVYYKSSFRYTWEIPNVTKEIVSVLARWTAEISKFKSCPPTSKKTAVSMGSMPVKWMIVYGLKLFRLNSFHLYPNSVVEINHQINRLIHTWSETLKTVFSNCNNSKLHIKSQCFHFTGVASGQQSVSPGMTQ